MERVRILIAGRVQGVGFRYYTCAQAKDIGVNGWVRNLPDGKVETEFEGTEESVEAMLAWCRRGPITAQVSSVSVVSRETVPAPEFQGFVTRG